MKCSFFAKIRWPRGLMMKIASGDTVLLILHLKKLCRCGERYVEEPTPSPPQQLNSTVNKNKRKPARYIVYCILYSKEDISLYCRSIGTVHPSSSTETPFPCLHNFTEGSWRLYRQTAIVVYSRQSSYTDREYSSQLTTRGGGGVYMNL